MTYGYISKGIPPQEGVDNPVQGAHARARTRPHSLISSAFRDRDIPRLSWSRAEHGYMCKNPGTIMVRGLAQKIPCRECTMCKENRVWDWVGRCLAESKTATKSSVVTLTYGTSLVYGHRTTKTLSAVVLHYPDIQRYFKRLRFAGYKFRYVVAGEYGKLKGRAHWHVLFFWEGDPPPHELRERITTHDYWTGHPDSEGGHTYWDDVSVATCKYVCKYLLKSEEEGGNTEFHHSTVPLIGASYFRRYAEKYVEAQILPQNPTYSFPEVRFQKGKRKGQQRPFYMSDAAADVFSSHLIAKWQEKYNCHPLDRLHSKVLYDHLDRKARRLTSDQLEQRMYVRRPSYLPDDLDQCVNPQTGAYESSISFDEKLNLWVSSRQGRRVYAVPNLAEGGFTWTDTLARDVEVAGKPSESKGSVGSAGQNWSARYRRESNGE